MAWATTATATSGRRARPGIRANNVIAPTGVVQTGRGSGRYETIDVVMTAMNMLGHSAEMTSELSGYGARPGLVIGEVNAMRAWLAAGVCAWAACGNDHAAPDIVDPAPRRRSARVTERRRPAASTTCTSASSPSGARGQPGLCHNGQFEPNLSTPP